LDVDHELNKILRELDDVDSISCENEEKIESLIEEK